MGLDMSVHLINVGHGMLEYEAVWNYVLKAVCVRYKIGVKIYMYIYQYYGAYFVVIYIVYLESA